MGVLCMGKDLVGTCDAFSFIVIYCRLTDITVLADYDEMAFFCGSYLCCHMVFCTSIFTV